VNPIQSYRSKRLEGAVLLLKCSVVLIDCPKAAETRVSLTSSETSRKISEPQQMYTYL